MKFIILILGVLVCLAATQIVFGQQEGTIDYEIKVNMHRTLPPERGEMKEMIPEFNTHASRLVFRSGETLYINTDAEEEDEEFGSEDGPVQVKMRRPMNEYYFNHPIGRRVAMMEFLGKYFLIEDSIKSTPWKLTEETKSLLGFICRKATVYYADRDQNITAWYSENLPPFIGPESFSGLPGTILAIDINGGERTITARKISFDKISKGALRIPTKGQKTTEASFRKMVQEQRDRMGRGGNVIIRH